MNDTKTNDTNNDANNKDAKTNGGPGLLLLIVSFVTAAMTTITIYYY